MFIQTDESAYCKFLALQNSEPAGRLDDYGHFFIAFAKSVRPSIVLSIE